MDKSNENVLKQYEEWHLNYNKQIVNLSELKIMPWHKSVLSELQTRNLENLRVLEVGCGNGDFSNYLSLNTNKLDITGVDFSNESIKIANEKKISFGALTSNFEVADAENLPFDNESFDLILSCECLEHVPNPQKMIEEIYRVLKKGGQIILTTENYSNAYAYYIAYLKFRKIDFDSGSSTQPIEHFFVFWKVKKMFRIAGFKNVRTKSKQYVLLLLPGFAPKTFTLEETKSTFLRFILKPFGRRYTYLAQK